METVALLSHKDADGFISVKMEYEDGVDRLPERVTPGIVTAISEHKISGMIYKFISPYVKQLCDIQSHNCCVTIYCLMLCSPIQIVGYIL